MDGFIKAATISNDATAKTLIDAELLKQTLHACSVMPGAKITITVSRGYDTRVTAEFCDHAALVAGLLDAVDDFISEL